MLAPPTNIFLLCTKHVFFSLMNSLEIFSFYPTPSLLCYDTGKDLFIIIYHFYYPQLRHINLLLPIVECQCQKIAKKVNSSQLSDPNWLQCVHFNTQCAIVNSVCFVEYWCPHRAAKLPVRTSHTDVSPSQTHWHTCTLTLFAPCPSAMWSWAGQCGEERL